MTQVPVPKEGCFEVAYPNKEWREVGCKTPPNVPLQPRHGARPLVMGNGSGISAQVPTAGSFITQATGSFDSVTGVTSESGRIGNSGPLVPNAYTLQINTDFFASAACAGSPNPTCRGWEQFVHWNDNTPNGFIFIQYWLIRYNAPCPAGGGWNTFSFTGSTDIYCWRNSPGSTTVPNQVITNLGNLVLTGQATATMDQVSLFDGTTLRTATGSNSVAASTGWTVADFNIYGPGGNSSGGSDATFNAGAAVRPRTRIVYGGTNPPLCNASSFTGETNNLSPALPAPAASAPGPAILFNETSAGAAMTNCAAATAVGDTHLHTFSGLFYDFQATGDFTLAKSSNPDFVVQARQVSGAPTWPEASVNSAVATQMGKNKIAVCQSPQRISIDGKVTDIDDGGSMVLPDGVDIVRRGNAYFIRDEIGNSVRATVNSTYIDVSVGMGRWPSDVKGLLVNHQGNVNQLEASDGTVLTNPFPFDQLYGHFADSWRVPDGESLLSACGARKEERRAPSRPFYANDLAPDVFKRAQAACVAAGVKIEALLEACTLDVAVIGDEKAAQVFLTEAAPVAVGKPTGAGGGAGNESTSIFVRWWWLWGLLLVLIAFLLWFFFRKRTTT